MKERLQKCQQTERQRITFGKVSLIRTPCLQQLHCVLSEQTTVTCMAAKNVVHMCLLHLGLITVHIACHVAVTQSACNIVPCN